MGASNFIRLARTGILALVWFGCLVTLANAQGNQTSLVRANTAFAFDLIKQIAASQPAGNLFISPYSVSSVLQMADDGAAGGTKEEMEHILHLEGETAPDEDYQHLDQVLLNGQQQVTLDLANSIWFEQGAGLKPEFLADCTNYFRSEAGAVDFSNPQSVNVINDWAVNHTQGRIKNVVQWPLDPMTRVILANAIYFKGHWAQEFDKAATKDRAFTLPDGKPKQVPMMQQHGHFNYYQGPGFQAVQLPYAGGRLQMDLFLPDTGTNIQQMLAGFDGNDWQGEILRPFLSHPGTVILPRFKLDYAVALNGPLKALGMRQAFSPDADFSAMSDQKLYLSEVEQKSYVEVNEEGTEAAAVTTGTFRATLMMEPEQPFKMILDHPFFFAITDQTTQSILFMGIVSDPAQATLP